MQGWLFVHGGYNYTLASHESSVNSSAKRVVFVGPGRTWRGGGVPVNSVIDV